VLGSTTTNASGNFSLGGLSGNVDLIITYPPDEDDYMPTWYTSSTDQSTATPINMNSESANISITALLK